MAEPPDWTQEYLEIPFKDLGRDRDGLDCYGLNRLTLADRFGIVLPAHTEAYRNTDDVAVIARMINAEIKAADSRWQKIPWERRQPYDWVLYRRGEVPAHLAVVADHTWVLHTFREAGSGCERVDCMALGHGFNFKGCFRHRAIPA